MTELYDALQGEPGVSVTGGAGRPQNITIRGMTGNRISIIRDGIRSADGFGANDINDQVGRDTFDLANVSTIELIKGASSSVHGSGAIGGAVILKSKQPSDFCKARISTPMFLARTPTSAKSTKVRAISPFVLAILTA